MGHFKRSEAVQSSRVGDRLVLHHSESQTSLILNPSGSRLWDFLAEPRTSEEMTDMLCEGLTTPDPMVVREDVDTYLRQLIDHALVDSAD